MKSLIEKVNIVNTPLPSKPKVQSIDRGKLADNNDYESIEDKYQKVNRKLNYSSFKAVDLLE